MLPPYLGVGVLVLPQYLDSRYAMQLLEASPERIGYLFKGRISDVAVLADALRRIPKANASSIQPSSRA